MYFFNRERQILKEHQYLSGEIKNLQEKNENILLIQKDHKNLDTEIYAFKLNDMEKENKFLLKKLQEKNQELIEITEKFYEKNSSQIKKNIISQEEEVLKEKPKVKISINLTLFKFKLLGRI